MHGVPRTAVRVQVQAYVGDTNKVEQGRAHTSNRGQWSTLSLQAPLVADVESE